RGVAQHLGRHRVHARREINQEVDPSLVREDRAPELLDRDLGAGDRLARLLVGDDTGELPRLRRIRGGEGGDRQQERGERAGYRVTMRHGFLLGGIRVTDRRPPAPALRDSSNGAGTNGSRNAHFSGRSTDRCSNEWHRDLALETSRDSPALDPVLPYDGTATTLRRVKKIVGQAA